MDKDKLRQTMMARGRRSYSGGSPARDEVLPTTPVAVQSVPAQLVEDPPPPDSYGPGWQPAIGQGPNPPKKSIWQYELTRRKVKREEVMQFSRQLSAFIRAGVPILEAIETFASESGDKAFRAALADIGQSLRRGETFSQAAQAHSEAFPPFYVDMLKAAELTGRLDSVLDQLALYMERDLEARQKIRGAMIYPAVIGVMSLVTVGILAIFVLPRFKTFFASLHAKLPLPTRIVLAITGFVSTWWWALLTAAVVSIVLAFLITRSEEGRRAFDNFKLWLPGISGVVRFSIIERFCRVLGAMILAGVPLPEAMAVVIDSIRNETYQLGLKKVRESMLEGQGLAGPIARSGLFPAGINQMVRVGENTGTLDKQLETAAGFYAQELNYKIKKLTTLFEPAMIIFMGLIVGFVAIALISAMYGIFRQVKVS